MRRVNPAATTLAERLCRPQRIGLFGPAGVGKTTLLTALYRAAAGGRLPDLRLAADAARTAEHFADKLPLAESAQPLPATVAATDLGFHLYHGGARLELHVQDYPGDQVAQTGPARAFLRDCDALWLCLDAGALTEWRGREQEIEQLLEDLLAAEPQCVVDRPVALLVLKADLLREPWEPHAATVLHALRTHCPHSARFTVSAAHDSAKLAEPLVWLVKALHAQDRARLEQLWKLAGSDLRLLERGFDCFAHRYPDGEETADFAQRLGALHRQRRLRRRLAGIAVGASLLAGIWSYDALGHRRAVRYAEENAGNPVAVLQEWETFQIWHPTRHWLGAVSAQAEAEQVQTLRQQARRQQYEEQFAELRRLADTSDADAEALWKQYQQLRAAYPEIAPTDAAEPFRAALKVRSEEQFGRRARAARDALVQAEQQGVNLGVLVAQAEQFLREFAGSAHEGDMRKLRGAYLRRIEERDIEPARVHSLSRPLDFAGRRERYQHYLDRHPGGAFTAEAETALRGIAVEWDKHDFRAVRDHFLAKPGDVMELVKRCQAYRAAHPQGKFTGAAGDLLRWTERVTAPGEYRVTLKSGEFEKKTARFFSRGPDLSVELEVNGVRYGPSPIVANQYEPEWNYEFPRRIRWKLGDAVILRVMDHDWKDRVVMEVASADGDLLGMRLLAGEVWSGKNALTFESDFALPQLPKIE